MVSSSVEALLGLEKQTRLSADIASSKIVVTAILQLLFDAQKWDLLNDNFRLLCNRRAQLKPVVQTVVQKGFEFVDQVKEKPVKVDLICVLREVSFILFFVLCY
jgi:26S proteasome regulatory subunit N5